MDDLISRQAALDAIRMLQTYKLYDGDEMYLVDKADVQTELMMLPSAQPEIIRCKDCKHFEYDHPYIIQGIPVLGHEVCNAWGDGCKTDQNGYCFMGERRTDETN